MTGTLQRARVDVLGTSAIVIASDPEGLALATMVALDQIDLIDRACSRFRTDSDLCRVNSSTGRAVEVSPTLVDAVEVALRAATVTDGDVDLTVGRALRLLGYDRTFDDVDPVGPPVLRVSVARRWREIEVDQVASTVRVPDGVEIDLGATAKALAADRAATAAAAATGCGVLVSIGGDIAVAGDAPAGGWPVRIGDHHTAALDVDGPTVAVFSGGVATSGTSARRWQRGGIELHHLVDPRTGRPATEVWRTVTVAAATCVDANIATTASMIRGTEAVAWLDRLGLPGRLVAVDGSVRTVGGWGGGAIVAAGRS